MAFHFLQSIPVAGLLTVSVDSGFTANVRSYMLIVIAFMLLAPSAVQADDIFDSQMKLAKQGNAEAQFKVGEMYEAGLGVNKNIREARYWLTRSANQDHETASFKLLYWDLEKKGLNDENVIKVEQLSAKAKQGNAQAQYFLGKMYAHGVGIKKNPDVAIDWLNKAALVGVLEAELELAALMEEKKHKAQKERIFKSDPCNDKTARFLSTC